VFIEKAENKRHPALLLAFFSDILYISERSGNFLKSRCMDNLFLNRMNSRQGIVKKEQETIFEVSMGSLHDFKFF
jgi:hypothetical protein